LQQQPQQQQPIQLQVGQSASSVVRFNKIETYSQINFGT
jgi:hypothetical protein